MSPPLNALLINLCVILMCRLDLITTSFNGEGKQCVETCLSEMVKIEEK